MKLIINNRIYFPTKIEVEVIKPQLCFSYEIFPFEEKAIYFNTNIECTRIKVYYGSDHDSFIIKGDLKEEIMSLLSENESILSFDSKYHVREVNDFYKDYGNKRLWNSENIKDVYWCNGFSSRFINRYTPRELFSVLQNNSKYSMSIYNV